MLPDALVTYVPDCTARKSLGTRMRAVQALGITVDRLTALRMRLRDSPRRGAIAFMQEEVLRTALRIEIYRASLSQAEYSDSSGCGAVVVWTR